MSPRLLILLAAVLPAVALEGQAPSLPPDINPVTLSRLPPVNRNDLDTEGQRIFDARANNAPGPGPGHISIYSPKVAEAQGMLGRYLGVPRGDQSPMGGRLYQLVVLITAREIDQQYEWSAHEPAGLRAGLEQSVIDVVKFDKDVTGLAEKDATVIRFFRGLFREHKVSSDLWAKMVEHFGRKGTIDMMALMSSYFTVGMMMNAVDQHLPPERQPLMPTLTRGR
jgi:4-carboxymuconolactone decarboxylase